MNEFQKKVEIFRTHYFTKYGRKLDDETLYFFIRVNEMQLDLKKQLLQLKREMESDKVAFRSGWDYFLYGFGRMTSFIFLLLLLISVLILFIKVSLQWFI